MICASLATRYVFTTATGTTRVAVLDLTSAGNTVVSLSTGCPVGQYGLLDAADLSSISSASGLPWTLTVAEGGQIAGAVIAVWVVAWGIRQIVRLIRESHVSSVDNS